MRRGTVGTGGAAEGEWLVLEGLQRGNGGYWRGCRRGMVGTRGAAEVGVRVLDKGMSGRGQDEPVVRGKTCDIDVQPGS